MFSRPAGLADPEASEIETVDGNSIVGNVNSNGGEFRLDRGNGNANPNDGVGLSVRQIVQTDTVLSARGTVYCTLLRQPPSIRPISRSLACS
jgi:hypothetical protein